MSTRAAAILGAVAALAVAVSSASASPQAPKPIVTVVVHGGYCLTGECREVFRITDTRISGTDRVPRKLTAPERRALLRAIRRLDPDYLRAHPFKGMCPTAYDGTESIYRFRGFSQQLASCKQDLRDVDAAKLTDRLLASLKYR
jgi:hypothetical protein